MSNAKLLKMQKKFGIASPGEVEKLDKLAEFENRQLKKFNRELELEKERQEKDRQKASESMEAPCKMSKETPWKMPIEALKILGWVKEFGCPETGTTGFEMRRKSLESSSFFGGNSVIYEGGYTPIIEFKTNKEGRHIWRTYFQEMFEESIKETESTLEAWSRFYYLIEEDYRPDDEFCSTSNLIIGFTNKVLENFARKRADEIAKNSKGNKDNNHKWIEKVYRMISIWAAGRDKEEGFSLWNKMDCLKFMARVVLANHENKFKNINDNSIAFKYPKHAYPHLIYGASEKLHVIGKLSIEYWEQQALRES